MECAGSRLGDDLHDAAGGLTVLRFKTACFYLDFLDERQVDTGRKRSVNTGIYADAAEAAVCNADAVRDIVVLKTRATRNGGIRGSSTAARSNTSGSVEEAGDAAAYWDRL